LGYRDCRCPGCSGASLDPLSQGSIWNYIILDVFKQV
jgi:hypothetical protein